ncbi:hypothetical protein D043_2758A, partial [Vibrio parahaemolyticus EKP-021]|jgi:hypothetical protein
MRLV